MYFSRGKIVRYILSVLFIFSINFFMVHLLPGDPLIHLLGEDSYLSLQARDPGALKELQHRYGLDQPVYRQFLSHLRKMITFDLGWSYQHGRPVMEVLLYRLKWTLVLLGPALLLSSFLGIFLGCLASLPGGKGLERVFTPLCLIVYAIPTYCLAFLLILLFSVFADAVPLGGMTGTGRTGIAFLYDRISHLLLPLTVLILHTTGYVYMIMRASLQQTLREAHVITALSKGLRTWRILMRHLLLNSLPPVITAIAIHFGFLVGGALLVEIVFSWQGMGTLLYEAVLSRDYPVLSACFMMLALCVIGVNLIADLLCAMIDPRIIDDVLPA